MLDTDCPAEFFKIQHLGRFTLDIGPGGSVGLLAGHGRDSVIKDYDGGIAVIIDNVDKTGDAGMYKCRVTDYRDLFAHAFLAKCLGHTMHR